jgi:hypothetical protein
MEANFLKLGLGLGLESRLGERVAVRRTISSTITIDYCVCVYIYIYILYNIVLGISSDSNDFINIMPNAYYYIPWILL